MRRRAEEFGATILRPVLERGSAPILCARNRFGDSWSHASCPAGVQPSLHSAYAAWAFHHAACATCRQHDWFMPGDLVYTDDPLLADGSTLINGRQQLWRRGADVSVLCKQGATLFRAWTYTAAVTPVFKG